MGHEEDTRSLKSENERLRKSLDISEDSKANLMKDYMQKLEVAKNELKSDFKTRQEQFSVVKVELEKEVLNLKGENEKLMNELKDLGHEKTKIETSLNVEIDHLQKSLDRETEKSASDNSKMRTNLKELEERNKK